MSNLLEINKHGSIIPVYNINNENQQIGYLNNREACVMYDTNGSNRLYIYFLDGNGNFTKGVIKEDGNLSYNLAFYTDYPVKREYIEGNQYMLFKMRRSMPIYCADSNYWGTVAANCYVATDRNLCGASHPNWAYINYVQSSNGSWVRVGYPADGYGFVDTGITTNSLYNGIALYGTW